MQYGAARARGRAPFTTPSGLQSSPSTNSSGLIQASGVCPASPRNSSNVLGQLERSVRRIAAGPLPAASASTAKLLRSLLAVLACACLSHFAHAQSNYNDLDPIPSFYQEPGQYPNREYVNQHFSEHIDPFTGKLQLHYVDLFIPGNGGLDIKVQRSYSSLDEKLGEAVPYGPGWTVHFGRLLRKATVDICDFNTGPTANPVLELPDGSRQILYVAPDGASFISISR